jgi:gamma-glutamyl phosphate reductase
MKTQYYHRQRNAVLSQMAVLLEKERTAIQAENQQDLTIPVVI